jgi:hypothetical protein
MIVGGGRKVIKAVIAAGLGGGPKGRMPGGKANAHGGTIGGMPGLGGAILGLIRRGAPIGNGEFGILPELNRAVV